MSKWRTGAVETVLLSCTFSLRLSHTWFAFKATREQHSHGVEIKTSDIFESFQLGPNQKGLVVSAGQLSSEFAKVYGWTVFGLKEGSGGGLRKGAGSGLMQMPFQLDSRVERAVHADLAQVCAC